MKKLTEDEVAQMPAWLREAIECLDNPSLSVPNCPPVRPYTPWEVAFTRASVKNGILRAEDYPGLLDAKERTT